MWILIRVFILAHGLHREAPWLEQQEALNQALAAVLVETEDVPAEIMLSKAIPESSFNPLAAGHGKWPADPAKMPRRASYACGVVQVIVHDRRTCVRLRDPFQGYAAGVAELTTELADCRRWRVKPKNLLRHALNYYAEGTRAGQRGWGVKCPKGRTRCDRSAALLARARRIASGGWRRVKPAA